MIGETHDEGFDDDELLDNHYQEKKRIIRRVRRELTGEILKKYEKKASKIIDLSDYFSINIAYGSEIMNCEQAIEKAKFFVMNRSHARGEALLSDVALKLLERFSLLRSELVFFIETTNNLIQDYENYRDEKLYDKLKEKDVKKKDNYESHLVEEADDVEELREMVEEDSDNEDLIPDEQEQQEKPEGGTNETRTTN